nr:type II methionyl aminopeptidase [Candidatus Njordarchaeum guaymaensis]
MRVISLTGRELECYRKAGRIASTIREKVGRLVQPGARIIRICEEAESMIRKSGGSPAFPLNVSVNELAAHYTSPPGDETVLPERGLVKIDLGVSVDGYVADTATTVDLSRKETMMADTTEKALMAAISAIKAGIRVSDVGKVISSVITRAGLKPISNLTGHSLARYELHSGISVPNVPVQLQHVMSEGEVYAIEPFATKADGKGFVKETKNAFIYSCKGETPTSSTSDAPETDLLNVLKRSFNRLPFAVRWLTHQTDLKQFGKLLKKGLVIAYPVLIEAGKRLVSQSEHTLIVRKHDCEVLTI